MLVYKVVIFRQTNYNITNTVHSIKESVERTISKFLKIRIMKKNSNNGLAGAILQWAFLSIL